MVRLPFFGIGKIAALRQIFGASPELKTLLQTCSRCSKSALDFQTSAGVSSSPITLPEKLLLIAEVTSSIVNSWTGIGKVSEMIVSNSSGSGGIGDELRFKNARLIREAIACAAKAPRVAINGEG